MITNTEITSATYDSLVQLDVDKIAEAVHLGPDKASLSTTEQIMVALATEDYRAWLPGSTVPEKEL